MLTPIATVEERLRIINGFRQSGLTANEWCRQYRLHPGETKEISRIEPCSVFYCPMGGFGV